MFLFQPHIKPATIGFVCFCLFSMGAKAQTLGGTAAYGFLRLSSSPLLAASGGVNISYTAGEVGLTANNPALLQHNVHQQINSSFNAFNAGTKAYSLTGAVAAEKLNTVFGGHVHYLDHNLLSATDAAGNITGQFRPVDFVIQVSAARRYLQKWTYGITLKFIQSSYGQFGSNAVAADVGVHYHDTAQLFSVAVVAKNMGAQLKGFTSEKEELPFDLQAGLTKRLAKAPIAFSLTAQHLQTFDILYDDSVFNRQNNLSPSSSAINKLLTHLVLATHLYVGHHLSATIGYNLLQRKELSINAEANGLTGFSFGTAVRFSKLQVLYARSAYQRGVASNQIGITIHMDKLFGLGR